MSARRALALTVAASALLTAFPALAAAQNGDARLQGTFALNGRVTVAVHVKAEHRGQHVARVWSFTPLCASGACSSVLLTRQRAGGTDTVTLQSVSPGYYRGQSSFAAPLGCHGQLQPSGETAQFTITVRITAASASAGGPIATQIKATYTSRMRINNTSCVLPPSRDAAVYKGTLVSATSSARGRGDLSALSPAGS